MRMAGNETRAVFFDIDGTIWNRENEIPPSTAAAVAALKRRGHLVLLCSGRTRGYIRAPELLSLDFDGIISGCGTMLEFGGETLFYHRIPTPLLERTLNTVRSFGFRPILEGREYLYFDEAEFGGDPYGEKLRAELGARLKTICGSWGAWEVSKLSCDMRGADRSSCFAAIAADFDPIVHNDSVVELVPKGFDKGDGILRFCARLGLDPARTVAFGDSYNDLGMFAAAGTSVAMGNGVEGAKRAADYVTTALMEDGVWNACRALELI